MGLEKTTVEMAMYGKISIKVARKIF